MRTRAELAAHRYQRCARNCCCPAQGAHAAFGGEHQRDRPPKVYDTCSRGANTQTTHVLYNRLLRSRTVAITPAVVRHHRTLIIDRPAPVTLVIVNHHPPPTSITTFIVMITMQEHVCPPPCQGDRLNKHIGPKSTSNRPHVDPIYGPTFMRHGPQTGHTSTPH